MRRLFSGVVIVMVLVAMQAVAGKAGWMDMNADGKVSMQEFCDARAKSAEKAGKEFKKENAEKQFAKKDVNGDGFLTGDELTAKPKASAAE
ncbi:MAG: hypothetical protein WC047_09450 [Kiritimatiellales bacterium]